MPELPEVETTRRGIAAHVEGRTVRGVIVREPRLRWPVPEAALHALAGSPIERVERRAKYLLLRSARGTVIIHFGMSGSLRVVTARIPPGPHDHVDLVLAGGTCLRLRDPRRFGSVRWDRCVSGDPGPLAGTGPEPLEDAFDGDYLHARSRARRRPVKAFIMDAAVVAGLGNIYANEALYAAGIHPRRAAGRISRARYRRLARAIRAVLERAITQGGTTLRDFTDAAGTPGYFRVALAVYGRAGLPCHACGTALRRLDQGQQPTVYCPRCQR